VKWDAPLPFPPSDGLRIVACVGGGRRPEGCFLWEVGVVILRVLLRLPF